MGRHIRLEVFSLREVRFLCPFFELDKSLAGKRNFQTRKCPSISLFAFPWENLLPPPRFLLPKPSPWPLLSLEVAVATGIVDRVVAISSCRATLGLKTHTLLTAEASQRTMSKRQRIFGIFRVRPRKRKPVDYPSHRFQVGEATAAMRNNR